MLGKVLLHVLVLAQLAQDLVGASLPPLHPCLQANAAFGRCQPMNHQSAFGSQMHRKERRVAALLLYSGLSWILHRFNQIR